ncbi:MAG TPA: KTSC domain-containing protein [Acidobacteriaceae bacterium]
MPSSVILAMQYEPMREELVIVFREGRGTYRYFDVAVEEWREFLEAESKGTYLNCVFKAKEHLYKRTDEVVRSSGRRLGDTPLEWGEAWALRKKGVRGVEAEGVKGKATA